MKKNLIKHFGSIIEIAVRNEVPFRKVLVPYIESNKKIYSTGLNAVGKLDYSPELDEKAFRLTERFLDYQREKEMNKLK